jgi:hypothetical protein
MTSDNDEPEAVTIALDADFDCVLGETTFLLGPLLLLSIQGEATIEVINGHPAESDSLRVCTISRTTLASGGMWIGATAFIVATTEETVRVRMPQRYVLRLEQQRTQGDASPARILRTLGRLGIDLLEPEIPPDEEATRLSVTVSVPYTSLERAVEYLRGIGVTVVHTDGQRQRAPVT